MKVVKMLNCKELSQLASEHIDGKLSIYMQMKVRMHLFMCHDCRNYIDQFRLTIKSLRQLTIRSPGNLSADKQVKILMDIKKY